MEDTEYELVSHDEVTRLKNEIERLKSNPFIQNSSEERLYEAVSHLNDSVGRLYLLFESINKQLMKEYQNGNSPEEKIDKLLDQNKSIAEALVSFGSKIDALQENSPQSFQAPQQFSQQQVSPQAPIQQQINSIGQTQNLQQQAAQSSYSDDTGLPPLPTAQLNQLQQAPINQQISPQMPQMQSQSPLQRQQQMAPAFQPQMQQFQQNFPQEQRFAQPQMNQQQPQAPFQQQMNQRQTFENGLDINYPVPDRFQPLNAPPSFDAPIDIRPEPPKKSGLFGGLIKK